VEKLVESGRKQTCYTQATYSLFMQKESTEIVLNILFPVATDLLLTYVDH